MAKDAEFHLKTDHEAMTLAPISDFFAWWLETLRALGPTQLRRRRKAIDIHVGQQNGATRYLIAPPAGTGRTTLAAVSLQGVEQLFRSDLRNVRAPVRVIHDVTRFVDRPLAETRLPLSRSVAAAYVDLGTNTPFRSEDVEIGLCSDCPSRYFIFRRTDLACIRKALGARRQDASIAVEQEGTIHAIDQRFLAGRPVRSQADRLQRAILLASVLVLILGAALIATIEQRRLSAADQALSSEVEIANARARSAKEQFDQQMRTLARMEAVRAEKNLSNSVAATWEELSRIIPDNTWVGDLQLTDDRLTITGFSESAAALISLLEASERFDGAEFSAPVARTPGLDAERFTMEASVVRRAAP